MSREERGSASHAPVLGGSTIYLPLTTARREARRIKAWAWVTPREFQNDTSRGRFETPHSRTKKGLPPSFLPYSCVMPCSVSAVQGRLSLLPVSPGWNSYKSTKCFCPQSDFLCFCYTSETIFLRLLEALGWRIVAYMSDVYLACWNNGKSLFQLLGELLMVIMVADEEIGAHTFSSLRGCVMIPHSCAAPHHVHHPGARTSSKSSTRFLIFFPLFTQCGGAIPFS